MASGNEYVRHLAKFIDFFKHNVGNPDVNYLDLVTSTINLFKKNVTLYKSAMLLVYSTYLGSNMAVACNHTFQIFTTLKQLTE